MTVYENALRYRKRLEGTLVYVALLACFERQRHDHHLNGISIRHWDGYSFGKGRIWGDTFPRYCSSLNVIANATGQGGWMRQSVQVLRGYRSLFTPEGRGALTFLYPATVSGQPVGIADSYANNQDWFLVHGREVEEQ